MRQWANSFVNHWSLTRVIPNMLISTSTISCIYIHIQIFKLLGTTTLPTQVCRFKKYWHSPFRARCWDHSTAEPQGTAMGAPGRPCLAFTTWLVITQCCFMLLTLVPMFHVVCISIPGFREHCRKKWKNWHCRHSWVAHAEVAFMDGSFHWR